MAARDAARRGRWPGPLLLVAAQVGCGGGESGGTDPGGGGAAGDLPFTGAIRVVTHPEQPMVVDLVVPVTAGAVVSATADDALVRSAELGRDAAEVTLRLRSVEPGSTPTVRVEATAEGVSAERSVVVEALPPLAGYVAARAITGAGTEGFRLFDLQTLPGAADSSLTLVDATGKTRWFLPHPGSVADVLPSRRVPSGLKLLADGSVLFVQDGDVVRVDELGHEVARLTPALLGVASAHHDIIPLPGDRFLVLGHEFRDVILTSTGSSTVLAGDVLVEFSFDGAVHRRWSTFDHLDVQREHNAGGLGIPDPTRPGVVGFDWTHANGLDYRAADGLVVVSLRHQNWVLGLDWASGTIRWRLGAEGDFTLAAGTWFHHQHSPSLLADGRLALYDNGNGDPDVIDDDERTRVLLLALDEPARAASITLEDRGDDYFSLAGGGVEALVSGRLLVTDSAVVRPNEPLAGARGRLVELDPVTGQRGWELLAEPREIVFHAAAVPRLPGE